MRIDVGFALGQSDVTVGQFREFVGATDYVSDAERLGGSAVYEESTGRSAERRGTSGKGNRRDSDLFGPYASPHLVGMTIAVLTTLAAHPPASATLSRAGPATRSGGAARRDGTERGLPAAPKPVLTRAVWRDGRTLRPQTAPARADLRVWMR